MSYEQKLEQEANLWGAEAERMAQIVPPEWSYHKHLRHNRVLHGEHIDAMLKQLKHGMSALELGCASGWLTLAMAQAGADALGLDVSQVSLDIAQKYYEKVKDQVKGRVAYQYADLNYLELEEEKYDIICIKATLHHLINMTSTIDQIYRALKPNGILWISDTLGEEQGFTVLCASALMFLLPTEVSYKDKISGLLRFGLKAPSRIKASMQAEGLSPFEGAGRDHNWLALVEKQFHIEELILPPAITGYISAQLKLDDRLAVPLLLGIKSIDKLLVRLNLLKPSARIVRARKLTQS